MAYSVHIPPHVGLFFISTTYSWSNFYTCDFYGLFCIFISPCWAYLFIFYSCMCLSLLKRYFMTTYLYLMTNSVHIVYYFVYLLLLGGLIFTFPGWLRARLSGDVFCTHTSYGDVFCTKGFFKGLFCTHTFACFTIFYKDHLFNFVYLLLGELKFMWCFMSTYTPGDLFCTHTSSWWTILYTWSFLRVYSIHLPPYVDLNSISTTSCLVYTLRNFTAYFVYFFSLLSLSLFGCYFMAYMCMFLCCPIQYIYILMVTYSLYKENFNVLFC